MSVVLTNLLFGKEVGMFLERSSSQDIILPEVGLQVSICVAKSIEKSLDEVAHSTGVTSGGGVAIIDPSHGQ